MATKTIGICGCRNVTRSKPTIQCGEELRRLKVKILTSTLSIIMDNATRLGTVSPPLRKAEVAAACIHALVDYTGVDAFDAAIKRFGYSLLD